jgi:hypothetical protein
MRKSRLRTAKIVFITVAGISLAACAQSSSWLDKVTPGRDTSNDVALTPGAPNADDYLRDLDALATGDPATQAELFADAESRATLTPDPSTTLRYALMLATPGHSGSDMQKAQSMLRESLSQTSLMTPSEVSLAHIYLNAIEDYMVLETEAQRLRQSSVSRQEQTEDQALGQRIATVEAENRRLRSRLADAEAKLEAITTIERSIREQGQ